MDGFRRIGLHSAIASVREKLGHKTLSGFCAEYFAAEVFCSDGFVDGVLNAMAGGMLDGIGIDLRFNFKRGLLRNLCELTSEGSHLFDERFSSVCGKFFFLAV